MSAAIPPKANRQVPLFHDAALYRQRHKIKICSTGSRTGAASTPDTIALPTPSCLPSASLQPSSSGSINEMEWLPPSLTASQCAKNVVLSATERKGRQPRSEEHPSELQSLMRRSYAVFCLKKNKNI